eukprot:364673-Chlamydomonas_euryale.AAC.1
MHGCVHASCPRTPTARGGNRRYKAEHESVPLPASASPLSAPPSLLRAASRPHARPSEHVDSEDSWWPPGRPSWAPRRAPPGEWRTNWAAL